MARLEVEIVGNVKNLEKSLATTLKELDKLKKEEKELTKAFKDGQITEEKYFNSLAKNSLKLKQASSASNSFKNSLNSTSKSTNSLSKSTISGNAALTSFNRTIQDAPFGIMGVSNNITDLTETFGYLVKKTGSAGGALKAMLQSLTGFGGISFAISAVTSLMVVFGDKLFESKEKQDDLTDSTKDGTKAIESQSKALDNLINGLDKRNQRIQKTTFNTIKEREELRALATNVRDYTSTEEERSRALEKLAKLYPKYFESLSVKDTNKLIKAEEKVNKILIRKAKTKETLNQLERAGRDVQLNILEINKLRGKQDEKSINRLKLLENETNGLRELQKQLREALVLYTSFNNSFDSDATNGSRPLAKLGVDTSGLSNGVAPIIPAPTIDTSLAQNSLQGLINKQNELNQNSLLVAQSVSGAFTTLGNNISSSLIQTQGIFGSFVGTIIQQSLKLVGQLVANSIKTAAVAKTTALTQITTSQAAAASKIASDAAMATSAVSSALVQIAAAKAVATGNAIVAGTQTAKASGPAAAFLLPVLIAGAVAAVGSAFKGIGGGGSTSTSGVAGGGSTSSGSVSSSTSSASFGDGGGTVVFEIAGTSLIGVLNRTLQQNGNLGGAISIST